MKDQKTFIFIVEVPPIFAKQSSANRAQYKIKDQKTFIFIVEVQPIFAKQSSANRAQYKIKDQKTFIFIVEVQPIPKSLAAAPPLRALAFRNVGKTRG